MIASPASQLAKLCALSMIYNVLAKSDRGHSGELLLSIAVYLQLGLENVQGHDVGCLLRWIQPD